MGSRSIFILGGILIIFVCILPLKHKIQEYKTEKEGALIEVQIISVPKCLGSKGMHPMHFKYDGNTYLKMVGCGFGDTYKPGDNIKLKHIDGTDIYLLEYESIESEFSAMIFLTILGLISIIYGIRYNESI